MNDDFSDLLNHLRPASRATLNEMLPGVYEELRRLAGYYLSRERPDHTLQPTALVHEAYLRLATQRKVDWRNRSQLLALAAQMMRRILINHAYARKAEKRQAFGQRVELDEALQCLERQCDVDVIVLDDALNRLSAVDARQAQVVELRCFGGLSVEEVAEALELSPATVKRDWSVARLWLRRELSTAAAPESAPE